MGLCGLEKLGNIFLVERDCFAVKNSFLMDFPHPGEGMWTNCRKKNPAATQHARITNRIIIFLRSRAIEQDVNDLGHNILCIPDDLVVSVLARLSIW